MEVKMNQSSAAIKTMAENCDNKTHTGPSRIKVKAVPRTFDLRLRTKIFSI